MMTRRTAIFGTTVLVLLVATALLPRIPQDQAYHHFADTRNWLGIPNALNVLSNLPFLLVGVLGLLAGSFVDSRERWLYQVCFAGVTLTAFGSSWYHWAPDNSTLVWDRLPMAVGFMALLAANIAERVSVRAGLLWLGPLLAAGVGSVFYWRQSELAGVGDLRPYLLVQSGPAAIIPLLIALFPPRYTHTYRLGFVLLWYAVAKILESTDEIVFSAGGLVSGHTLKHLAAAWACYELVRMLKVRRPVRSQT